MKCTVCGASTRVTDSRDDRHPRNDWLVRYGNAVFGWYSRDFRLRKRVCQAPTCGHKETTIEVTLDDLEDSFDDLRTRGRPELDDRMPRVSNELLEHVGKLNNPGGTLSARQFVSLVQELLARRSAETRLHD